MRFNFLKKQKPCGRQGISDENFLVRPAVYFLQKHQLVENRVRFFRTSSDNMNRNLLILQNRIQIFGGDPASEMAADKDGMKDVVDFKSGLSRISVDLSP